MIDEKKIEEAAYKFAFNHGDTYGRYSKDNVIKAFRVGVEWFLDNLWHDASEEAQKDKNLLVERIYHGEKDMATDRANTLYDSWKTKVDREKITRWLYVDDLLKGGK